MKIVRMDAVGCRCFYHMQSSCTVQTMVSNDELIWIVRAEFALNVLQLNQKNKQCKFTQGATIIVFLATNFTLCARVTLTASHVDWSELAGLGELEQSTL